MKSAGSILMTIEDLGLGFKNEGVVRQAIEHITFHIRAGITTAIVGESGSGKSVTSLSLMSLLDQKKAVFNGGHILLTPELTNDREMTKGPINPYDPILKSLRGKGISMIFQEPMTSLNPVMTCGEQVAEMTVKHMGLSRENARLRTIELFEEVRLPRAHSIFDQYPHQLSGGQRQRVMIAMSISCNPSILIADEPTTALDVTVQKEILLLLKALQEKHQMALVFITHDLGVVAEIADEVIVMQRGRIVEQGNTSAVLQHPKHDYTKALLACRPEPGKKGFKLRTVENAGDDIVSNDDIKKIVDIDASNNDVLLSVRGLSKIYRHHGLFKKSKHEVAAVDDVTFEILRGETVGLVGESGCGKTTLSRMLLGLIPASEGQIHYSIGKTQSFSVTELSAQQLRKYRKDIQIIFQDPYSSLNPKHTVGDAIMEPMLVYGLNGDAEGRKKKAIALIEKVGLSEEHLSCYPHEFSGGQRQRIVIARALACEPSFIICDESVSALDVSVQAQVLNLLNDLKREFSLSYLFISHDLNVVYYMSDRILVMNKGRIVEAGNSDDIFFTPKEEYTQKLLSSIPGRVSGQR